MVRDIVLIVISALVGTLIGSVFMYLTERLRRLYVYVDEWSMSATKATKGVRRADEAGDIECYLTVRFFNRKSQAIGLHHIRFIFGTGRKSYIENGSVATRLVDSQGHSQYVAGSVIGQREYGFRSGSIQLRELFV